MTTRNYIAVDLGAGSGRIAVGKLQGNRLSLEEVHRFPNNPVRVAGHLHWNVLGQFEELLHGLSLSARRFGVISSIGVNTWGVDFGLLDEHGVLIGNPYHYRDDRTRGVMERALEQVSREEIFQITGTQFMPLNTLYQLYAMHLQNSPALEMARTLLLMPDLINYWLTGERLGEFTIATTSQCCDLSSKTWAMGLLDRLGLPSHIFPPIIHPETTIALLLPCVDDVGLQETRVVAPACHDTASAVAAIPAATENYAYISSGTWSLMGVVVPRPIVTEEALRFNFTNEGGVGGTIRLLKQIAGMWLIQECRRMWTRAGQDLSYDAMNQMATRARPFQALIDPDNPAFVHPEDMPQAIRQFCIKTGQTAPAEQDGIVRSILEGMALKYRMTLAELEQITGHHLAVIHVVGGGSQNQVLCQFTADACARPVLAGPVEATALGNVLAQALVDGACGSWSEARAILRANLPLKVYEPEATDMWDDAYPRYRQLLDKVGSFNPRI